MAPTGSSTRSRSNMATEYTTMTPPMAPMTAAAQVSTAPTGAVIATSPARRPLAANVTSGFPSRAQLTSMALTAPAQAATRVLREIGITNSSAASSEPGLNPNQPMNRIMAPRTTNGIEWPGIARSFPSLVYRPSRGPRTIAPINAAQPPVACTMVDPAKSENGVLSCASHQPLQVHLRTTG